MIYITQINYKKSYLSIISIITLVILYYISQIKINILEKKINKLIRSVSLKDIFNKLKDE